MLTSKRFYFLRAWYDWMTDNQLTPHIIVDAEYPGVSVPEDYIENGRITLNVAPQAISDFKATPYQWVFEADFDEPVGLFSIIVPIRAIIAIYAQENKQGAFFLEDQQESEGEVVSSNESAQKNVPAFKVVDDTNLEE